MFFRHYLGEFSIPGPCVDEAERAEVTDDRRSWTHVEMFLLFLSGSDPTVHTQDPEDWCCFHGALGNHKLSTYVLLFERFVA